MRARGHRVTLAANENFRGLAAEHGLDFRPLVTDEETRALFGNPGFWDPLRGTWIAARWGARLIARQYEELAELASDRDAVLAAVPALFAARLVQEKLARPLVSVILQPWMIPSAISPPAMPGGLSLPPGTPLPIADLYWMLFDLAGAVLAGGRLNRLRASLGLKPVRRMFRWWYSPQRVLGLFPDWYGQPAADWPVQMRLTGFPNYDGKPRTGLATDVREFCSAGPPPVVFTFGTGMMHAAGFFRAAVKACRLLGVRGLFLTKYTRQLPSALPPYIRHCTFAPFQELFPHCAAVVHHGGVGTTARAGRGDAAAGPSAGLRPGRQRRAGEEPWRRRLAQRPPPERRPPRPCAGPDHAARSAGALPGRGRPFREERRIGEGGGMDGGVGGITSFSRDPKGSALSPRSPSGRG